jgi:hypothetical protein
MTIYKDGFGLIKQPVNWDITSGLNSIRYDRVPKGMIPQSPFLMLPGANIHTQRLDFNIFSGESFFKSKIGHTIELKVNGDKEVNGILLELSPSMVTLQTKSTVRSFPRSAVDGFSVKEIIEAPQFRPELSWDINAESTGRIDGELVYTSKGFEWDAIYRMVLDEKGNSAELISEAYITNHSNVSFSLLTLQLVEGTLSRVSRTPFEARGMAMKMDMMAESIGAGTVPIRETLGDYHIYRIPGVMRLEDNESITVRLYTPRDVTFTKTYLFENYEQAQREEPLTVQLSFANTEDNNLGIPIPQGLVELYTLTEGGSLEFLGEDQIKQVPKGSTAELIAGRAFDVIGKRTVINYDRQRKSEEASIQIHIRNTKDHEVLVHAIEKISGDWVIRDESTMYIKDDASTIYFPVTIPAGGEQYITYTYRKEWN